MILGKTKQGDYNTKFLITIEVIVLLSPNARHYLKFVHIVVYLYIFKFNKYF